MNVPEWLSLLVFMHITWWVWALCSDCHHCHLWDTEDIGNQWMLPLCSDWGELVLPQSPASPAALGPL